jgi:release factor glutamine methyltransferase
MRIASNKLSDLYEFYKSELSSIYDSGELYAIFELVCEKFLGYSKSQVKSNFQEKINQSDLINIYNTGKELQKGIPVQYVLKEAFFYGLTFRVSPATLIPRPETEELVDLMIRELKKSALPKFQILDIGTGSGCIPVSLKKYLPEAAVTAIDVSEEALQIAKSNAIKHDTDIDFVLADILSTDIFPLQTFNVIVSNPPYVLNSEAAQMEERVVNHEPHLALFVEDNDPIIFYKRIVDLCASCMESRGLLFFELNPLYAQPVKNYADAGNFFIFTEILNDMSGKQRFLKAQKK